MKTTTNAWHITSAALSRSIVLTAVLLLSAACGSDSDSTSPTTTEAGAYTLVSVNGQTPPVTMTNTAIGTVVIQSGTLTLTPGTPSKYTAAVGGTASGVAAPALIGDRGDSEWIYFLGPALGAIIAWLIHTVVVKGELGLKPTPPRGEAESTG